MVLLVMLNGSFVKTVARILRTRILRGTEIHKAFRVIFFKFSSRFSIIQLTGVEAILLTFSVSGLGLQSLPMADRWPFKCCTLEEAHGRNLENDNSSVTEDSVRR